VYEINSKLFFSRSFILGGGGVFFYLGVFWFGCMCVCGVLGWKKKLTDFLSNIVTQMYFICKVSNVCKTNSQS